MNIAFLWLLSYLNCQYWSSFIWTLNLVTIRLHCQVPRHFINFSSFDFSCLLWRGCQNEVTFFSHNILPTDVNIDWRSLTSVGKKKNKYTYIESQTPHMHEQCMYNVGIYIFIFCNGKIKLTTLLKGTVNNIKIWTDIMMIINNNHDIAILAARWKE